MRICPNCQTELPETARFCFHCGAPQEGKGGADAQKSPPWKDDPAQYFVDIFMKILRGKVAEEHSHDQDLEPLYIEKLYASGFRDTLQRRAEQFAQQAAGFRTVGKVHRQIDELVEYFMVRFCVDLNRVPWPEAMLKYQGFSWAEIDLFQMALDYLDFAHESEVLYTDFLQMPLEKLRTAGQSFLFPEKQERILLICDQSILGTCREGFALTEKGLYWKAPLAKAAKVYFEDLRQINCEKDWLRINGYFFNAGPTLNVKMMRLLRAARRILFDVV